MLFKVESNQVANSGSDLTIKEIERQTVEYSDCSKRFYQVSRDFSKQYAHIYAARLNTFRNILSELARKRWSNKYKILKLCELREKNDECVVIGTLFKHQELKPSILKELSDELDIIPPAPRTHFVHESDTLVLEDELQRIKLAGDCIDVHQVVTGVVCAILGSEDGDGLFTVKDVCWPGCNIQKPLPKLADNRYIVILSGLNLSSKSAEHWFPLQLLLEWLAGVAGTDTYQEEVSKIVRVIIAGGTFTSNSTEGALNDTEVISCADGCDALCAAMASAAPLDLMPGCRDPAGVMLPQKPFHYCLFPKAAEFKSFNRVSNPYECDVGGFLCLGTSGEPIKDIMRYSNIETTVEAMKMTLTWRHLAPTCPDTVPTTPCLDTDPFTIYNCPAVYFCGNSDQYATDVYEGSEGQKVRLICVPDFSTTHTVALVNLSNLECYSMTFS